MRLSLVVLVGIFVGSWGLAGQKVFPVFDGQYYNGLYYPRLDIIEWGNPAKTHLEFHFYSKNDPVDIAAEIGMKSGKPVLWLNYHFKNRGENVCRHAPAPAHFREGDPIYAYVDRSDRDYDNIYISNAPLAEAKAATYNILPYSICTDDEFASNKPDASASLAKGGKNTQPARSIASDGLERDDSLGQAVAPAAKNPTPGKLIDYENSAVPFSF